MNTTDSALVKRSTLQTNEGDIRSVAPVINVICREVLLNKVGILGLVAQRSYDPGLVRMVIFIRTIY